MARSGGDDQRRQDPAGGAPQLAREGTGGKDVIVSGMLMREKHTNGYFVPPSLTKGTAKTKRGR